VKLTSSDNQMFEVEEEIANESQTVKNMIEGKRRADHWNSRAAAAAVATILRLACCAHSTQTSSNVNLV
jgi:hypothetical protein